ncbi:phosphate transporter [Rhodopirellula maiorica SM1]|uniref:Phosphate transporter n=1 Tax=Rhodopirellula maiorica SM1 TaxID=1265738 RepID=M5RNF2_9BACT|nr:inorganic phosphate transporter [Rhodopirellula maiorica]EMI15514.1 phosphate transporter [Rhodopirellula maiorica SM1]
MIVLLALVAGVLLAYANGANDNFKGVATLYGSGTTTYRRALVWATASTAAGSLTAVWLARELLARFSGKGIVPNALVAQNEFGVAVALAAGATVMLASRFGFPISTTHALVGSMVGAAGASTYSVDWHVLSAKLMAPLLLSPLIAIAVTAVLYLTLRRTRIAMGITKETCLCSGREVVEVVPIGACTMALARAEELSITLGTNVSCRDHYAGNFVGVDARGSLDAMHFLSAGMVSFARGLNDTPKIAALLLIVPALDSLAATVLCGLAIAVGGWFGAKKIAEKLSHGITEMNAGQGFSANLVTSVLVVFASRWGLPVSTTHVSCGAIFGIGTMTGQTHWKSIGHILLAWITTLPVAAAFAWIVFQWLA